MDKVPIIIDNGSYQCRAGYSSKTEPSLIFRNIVGRSRSRQKLSFVGDIDALNPLTLKSPFEQNLITQIDVQETIFDHIFENLDVESLTNPIVFNEALFCPQKCRAQLSELLLEQYSVEKIAFFVDGLSSHFYNYSRSCGQRSAETIMVSFGHQTTHIIPLTCQMGPKSTIPTPVSSACRRLSIGGGHISWYLQQLLHLKYPCHIERVTAAIADQIVQTFCRVAVNYRDEMLEWLNDSYRTTNTSMWELPYSNESQEKANEVAERRQLQAERLRELHRKRMLDKKEDKTAICDSCSTVSYSKQLKIDTKNSNLSKTRTEVVELNNHIGTTESDIETETIGKTILNTETVSPSTPERIVGTLVPLRLKKSSEFLISLTLPSAVQTQMTSIPPSNLGLYEQKLQRRKLAAIDLEAKRGVDFPLWLMHLQHKRMRIIKQRSLRQSRIELATELGVNSAETSIATFPKPEESDSTGKNWRSYHGKEESFNTSNSGTLSMYPASGIASRTAVLSERRQRQLEKLRALTAELKPERDHSMKKSKQALISSKKIHRNQDKESVQKKSSKQNKSKELVGNAETSSVNSLVVDGLDFLDDTTGLDRLEAPPREFGNNEDSQLPTPDDELEAPDVFNYTETNTRQILNISSSSDSTYPLLIDKIYGRKFTKDNFDRLEDASDVSEGERDQLAVIDSVRAVYDPEFIKEAGTSGLKVDLSEFYKIGLGTEKIRTPEVFFERSLLGGNQVGIGECLSWTLKDSSRELSIGPVCTPWIPKCLFLTGGPAQLPGMKERILFELTRLLPWNNAGNPIEVVVADNPNLNAWHGARLWSLDAEERGIGFTTRKDYEECGFEYLVENSISNRFFGSTKHLHTNRKLMQGRCHN